MRDQVEGDCKGFGFVEYREGEAAERAVRELNGAQRLGSRLKFDTRQSEQSPKLAIMPIFRYNSPHCYRASYIRGLR